MCTLIHLGSHSFSYSPFHSYFIHTAGWKKTIMCCGICLKASHILFSADKQLTLWQLETCVFSKQCKKICNTTNSQDQLPLHDKSAKSVLMNMCKCKKQNQLYILIGCRILDCNSLTSILRHAIIFRETQKKWFPDSSIQFHNTISVISNVLREHRTKWQTIYDFFSH